MSSILPLGKTRTWNLTTRERDIEGLLLVHYTLPRPNAIRTITKIFPRRKRWKLLTFVYARNFFLLKMKSFFGFLHFFSFNLFFLFLSRYRLDEARISCFSIIFFRNILFKSSFSIFHFSKSAVLKNYPDADAIWEKIWTETNFSLNKFKNKMCDAKCHSFNYFSKETRPRPLLWADWYWPLFYNLL